MARITAFLLGIIEFRDTFTSAFTTDAELNAYEWGREWAHRITFRRYEP